MRLKQTHLNNSQTVLEESRDCSVMSTALKVSECYYTAPQIFDKRSVHPFSHKTFSQLLVHSDSSVKLGVDAVFFVLLKGLEVTQKKTQQ